jgi:hypothetical protein
LRADPGLAELVGQAVPSPDAASPLLCAFHNEALITAAQARQGPEALAYIPEETAPRRGLAQVNRASGAGRPVDGLRVSFSVLTLRSQPH